MKKIGLILTAAILTFGLISTTAFKPLPPRPSANGQGTLTVADQTRHFSFSANTLENSSVEGSGQLTYIAGGVKIEFTIDCMSRVGNAAAMSGIVTAVSGNTDFQVGMNCWFKVVDNGEGRNAAPDEITLLHGSFGVLPCELNVSSSQLRPIEGGNIQVKN